jgi:hypothetical protein
MAVVFKVTISPTLSCRRFRLRLVNHVWHLVSNPIPKFLEKLLPFNETFQSEPDHGDGFPILHHVEYKKTPT